MKRVIKLLDKINIKHLILFLWVLFSFYYTIQLIIINSQFLDAFKLRSMEDQKQRLREENLILENEIAQKESFSYIEPLAKTLGFTKSNVVFMQNYSK